jgi:precorrin-6B methylase 2
MSSERQARAAIVRKFHEGSAEAADSILERALRIAPGDEKHGGELPELLQRFGNQNFSFFGGTPFHEIREIFRAISPQPHEVFCDAGAGYGHVVFYGASVVPCRFRAIEILPVRCAAMRQSARGLGLTNVDIVEGDALTQNYEDVSYLLLNSPFFPDVAEQFIGELKKSRTTVIAMNNIVDAFREDGAFTEIDIEVDIPNYRFGMFRLNKR